MTNRRVRDVASTKKSDTQVGRTTAEDDPATPNTAANLHFGQNYFLWSPSYMEQNVASGAHENRTIRDRQRIYFRGVRDNVFLTTSAPVMWRRVVFFMHMPVVAAQPYIITNEVDFQHYYSRKMNRLDPDGNDENLFEYLFRGTVGRDYTVETRFNAPMDNRNVKVLSDRKVTINPSIAATGGGNIGKIHNRKLWHPVNRSITYRDEEDGRKILTSGWSTNSPQSPGNLFILDVFSSAHGVMPPDSEMFGGGR